MTSHSVRSKFESFAAVFYTFPADGIPLLNFDIQKVCKDLSVILMRLIHCYFYEAFERYFVLETGHAL